METCSVIIPSFNRPRLTARALRSVLSQTYEHTEIIIVDDGSSPALSLAPELAELVRTHGALFRIVRQVHQGVAAARNAGMQASRGSIISFLDSDDYWEEDKLAKQVAIFERDPSVHVVQNFEQWYRFDTAVTTPVHLFPGEGDIYARSLEMCCLSCSSFAMRRGVFERIGFFNTRLRIAEDYDYGVRLALHYPVYLLPEKLTHKCSGGHPQLSDSEVAIDRFRVVSLLGILPTLYQEDPKREALKQVLLQKLRVLSTGASKRMLTSDLAYYQAATQFVLQDTTSTDSLRRQLSAAAEQILNVRPKRKEKGGARLRESAELS